MSVELSVVVPVYNEEDNVRELHRRLGSVLGPLVRSYEIVFVDDGSKDRSWAIVSELAAADPQVKGLSFSRNFGHQMAFAAGLDHASGEAVVIMDADLQDPPEVIPELVSKWREGHDVVYAQRRKREGETAFKLFTAALFYRLLRRITQVDVPVDTGDFRLMSARAVAAFRRMPEHHRFTRGLVAWMGFRQVGVQYVRAARRAGETKYTMRKMLRLATDGLTAFSRLPLLLALWVGALLIGAGAVGVLVFAAIRLAGTYVSGLWGLAAGVLALAGVQLVGLGLLGEWVGRIYEEVKRRPLYLVQDTVNLALRLPESG
ncbi:MAG TPA: glycosyltransferase family 2 protein [Thermoanaerobaculaceae bacterium]|nr:glycosyltransferase family 2 protein [Thermoanaerobaculaceae bacterium]HRS15145.1 glycosyltransferase family 2 protein [Thermoanaerobaculaceae bacterium]